jgi:hypothetical protein
MIFELAQNWLGGYLVRNGFSAQKRTFPFLWQNVRDWGRTLNLTCPDACWLGRNSGLNICRSTTSFSLDLGLIIGLFTGLKSVEHPEEYWRSLTTQVSTNSHEYFLLFFLHCTTILCVPNMHLCNSHKYVSIYYKLYFVKTCVA